MAKSRESCHTFPHCTKINTRVILVRVYSFSREYLTFTQATQQSHIIILHFAILMTSDDEATQRVIFHMWCY